MLKILPAAMLAVTLLTGASCAGPRYSAGVGVRFGVPPPPRYGGWATRPEQDMYGLTDTGTAVRETGFG
jgi:hypothetical protein